MNINCPACENDSKLELRSEDKEIVVRSEPIRFKMDYRKCLNCGEEFIVPDIDDDPLEKAFRLYREKYGLLQPEEIIDFRNKYHLTQRELAALLHFGGATISRYENGELQDETHDKLLKLAMDCENLRKLVIDSEDVFTPHKKDMVLKAIDENTGNMVKCLQEFVTFNLEDSEPYEYRGFKRFDKDKFFNAILYFCKEGAIKTKLNKLLFYADFLHFKEYTISITGAQYARVPFGPAPNNYDLYYPVLIRQGAIDIEEIEYPDYRGDKYIAKQESDLSIFSESELRILASVKEHFKDCNASEISMRSHRERGYQETETGDIISYKYAENLSI